MYKVDIEPKGGRSFKVKSKDYEFMVGHQDNEISPSATFLAGLGACIGVYIRKYAKGAKIDLGEYSIRVEADFGVERPICFRNIDISIKLANSNLDERRKKAILGFVKNCPIHNTLKANPAVSINIV